MKKFVMALVLLASAPAFAGKMKEIYMMTEESVMYTLGFDEDVIKIEGFQFIQVPGADLAVQTDVRSYFSRQEDPASFKCVTTFVNVGGDYEVDKTKCELLP